MSVLAAEQIAALERKRRNRSNTTLTEENLLDTITDLTQRLEVSEAERESLKFQWDKLQDRLHADFVARTEAERQLAALNAQIARKSLFVDGEFTSHGGLKLPDKIELDNATNAEIELWAKQIAADVAFCEVFGIPRGGERLAKAMEKYRISSSPIHLIVDDVFTTGTSMELAARTTWTDESPIQGYVVFARGPLPSWIKARYIEGKVADVQIASAEARARLDEAKRGGHEYTAYPHQRTNPIGRCQQCERIADLEKQKANG